MKVRNDNDIEGWIKFFLNGVIVTAEKSVSTFDKILKLEKEYDRIIQQMGSRSANVMRLLSVLYNNPIINASEIAKVLTITPASAYTLISEMEARGIIAEITGGKRGKRYILKDYFKLFVN